MFLTLSSSPFIVYQFRVYSDGKVQGSDRDNGQVQLDTSPPFLPHKKQNMCFGLRILAAELRTNLRWRLGCLGPLREKSEDLGVATLSTFGW
ncbi:hypothetical protein V2G26_019367 [Clonostachys chloroleuca]